ncbi:unknown [Bacteroides caccae CAG:21]|nr:unknown [Bacteroides caccae CAG:21]
MRANPERIALPVIIQAFDFVLRKAVHALNMPVPLKLLRPAVVQIHSPSFRSNPELPIFSFYDSAHYGRAKPFTLIFRDLIMSVYLIIGIKIVDPSEVGAYPEGPLMIFEDTEDRRIAQTAGSVRSSIMGKDSGSLIQFIQAPFGTYPEVSLFIFTNIPDGIIRNTIHASCLSAVMGGLSIRGDTV